MRINISDFDPFVDGGYITKEKHPDLDLIIWGYTQKTIDDVMWLPETILCNGLITKSDGTIVERPFQKFFTLEDQIELGLLPESVPIITELIDGRMGVLYWRDDIKAYSVASRNSFVDSVAITGTEIIRAKYPFISLPKNTTCVLNVLAPELTNLIDYVNEVNVVAIAFVNKNTGTEVALKKAFEIPVAKRHEYESIEVMMSEMDTLGRKGLVLLYPKESLRLKFVFESYEELKNQEK